MSAVAHKANNQTRPLQGRPFTTHPHRVLRPASTQEQVRPAGLAFAEPRVTTKPAAVMPVKVTGSGQNIGAENCSPLSLTSTYFLWLYRKTMRKHNPKPQKILTFGSAQPNLQTQWKSLPLAASPPPHVSFPRLRQTPDTVHSAGLGPPLSRVSGCFSLPNPHCHPHRGRTQSKCWSLPTVRE